MVNEHVDTQHTRLIVDDWLLQNGQKGRIARLLSQIQIIRVADLIQLAICLAVYPSSNLHQETPEEALMIIIHDMSILPSDSTQTDVATTSASPTPGSHYLPIVGNGLAAVQLCKNKSQLLVLDSYMDSSSRQALKCYLEEERISLDLPSDGLA
ncbi:hypothetical protein FRC18_009702 [Serendipita sp. 400]|nr:hypothetical protein FRC18_009702 [Serendipita sp. 400]